ncbi:MAG: PilZ domain-containing protein [bacterium]
MKERRQYIRIKARLYIRYKSLEDEKIEGHCWSRDISVAGIGVLIKEKLNPGMLMELTIDIQDKQRPLIVRTKVYWQVENPQDEEASEKLYRTGMVFVDIGDEKTNRIENLIGEFLKASK